jgi:hypothetical protein
MTTNDNDSLDDTDIDDRDRRALIECMSVIPKGGDVFEVHGENDGSYRVDTRQDRCTCPDHEHRGTHCKHLRRACFASGQRPIPPQIDSDEIDDLLGEHCDGEPYFSRAGTSSNSSRAAATDGSGARAVDPDRPVIPPYSDDNYDDRFEPGGDL